MARSFRGCRAPTLERVMDDPTSAAFETELDHALRVDGNKRSLDLREIREWLKFLILLLVVAAGAYKFLYEETIKPKFEKPSYSIAARLSKEGMSGDFNIIRVGYQSHNDSHRDLYINATWFKLIGYVPNISTETPVNCSYIAADPLDVNNRVTRCSTYFPETLETIPSSGTQEIKNTIRPKGEILAIGKFNDQSQGSISPGTQGVQNFDTDWLETVVFVPKRFHLLHLEVETRFTADERGLPHVALVIGNDGSLHEEFTDEKGAKVHDDDGHVVDIYSHDPEISAKGLTYIRQHNSLKTFAVSEIYLP